MKNFWIVLYLLAFPIVFAQIHIINGRLDTPKQGVEYAIIVPEDFLDEALPLARHREQQKLHSACITIESIVKHYGLPVEKAIKSFLLQTRQKWPKPELQFVVLAADVDVPGKTGIPTWQVRDYQDKIMESDYPYGQKDAKDLSLFKIGRLPARTSQELKDMAGKIIEYESGNSGAWQRRVTFVVGEGRFGKLADSLLEDIFKRLLNSFLPPWTEMTMSYANPNSSYYIPAKYFRALVASRFNQGSLFFVYAGHGHKHSFGYVYDKQVRYPIFNQKDLSYLKISQGYPIVAALACYTAKIDEKQDCLGEALIKMRHGPVVFIGATRVCHPYVNVLMGRFLLEGAFRRKIERLGELIHFQNNFLLHPPRWDFTQQFADRSVKYFIDKDVSLADLRFDHIYMYNLLGDPALRIAYPQTDCSLRVRYQPKDSGVEFQALLPDSAKLPCKLTVSVELSLEQNSSLALMPQKKLQPLSGLLQNDKNKKYLENYLQANSRVLIRRTAQINNRKIYAALPLPNNLPQGEYWLKIMVIDQKNIFVAAKKFRN